MRRTGWWLVALAVATAVLVEVLISGPKVKADVATAYVPVPATAFVPYPDSTYGAAYHQRPSDAPRASIAPTPVPTAAPTLRATPRPTIRLTGHRLVGTATWYCLTGVSGCMAIHPGGLYAAAGPALRAALGVNWRGRAVLVRSTWNTKGVVVILADWCACGGGHVIDLYSDAMKVIDPGYRTNGGVKDALITW